MNKPKRHKSRIVPWLLFESSCFKGMSNTNKSLFKVFYTENTAISPTSDQSTATLTTKTATATTLLKTHLISTIHTQTRDTVELFKYFFLLISILIRKE